MNKQELIKYILELIVKETATSCAKTIGSTIGLLLLILIAPKIKPYLESI